MACLQQTVTTAPAPAATAASAVDQGNATSTQPANASDSERDSMEYQDADARVQVSDPGTKTPMQERARNPVGDEDGWQMVLTLRQKKALAQGKKLKNSVDDSEGKASQPQQTKPTTNAGRKRMFRKLPPLPKDDFKVVIRPHQGLPMKNLTSPQLAEAVITACRGQVSGDKFLLRLKPGSNIFIVSTPDQSTADHIRRITALNINGRMHAVNAYVASGDGTVKGVIHGLAPQTPAETLMANLRIRTQGVEILRARMLGNTKTAVVTFYGSIIPRYVYYMGGELACYPSKNTVQFCNACQQTGHRTDVCPQPDLPVCRKCGRKDPQVDHDCRPTCASCGGDHLTGDKECKRRLKPQVRPRTKTPSKNPWKNAPKLPPPGPRWLSSDDSEDEDDEWPSLPREVDTKPRGRSRSRPRTPSPAKSKRSKGTSCSRSRSRSRRRDADINMLPPKLHSPQLNLRPRAPGNKAESTDHTKVSWVGTVKPEAPITSHPEYQRVLAENRMLKRTLEEIKHEIAALRGQIKETAKIEQPKINDVVEHMQPAQNPIEAMLQQMMQQILGMQNFQKQLLTDFQNLKEQVDELASNQKLLNRKRTAGSPNAPTLRKTKNGAVPNSTGTNSVTGHGS